MYKYLALAEPAFIAALESHKLRGMKWRTEVLRHHIRCRKSKELQAARHVDGGRAVVICSIVVKQMSSELVVKGVRVLRADSDLIWNQALSKSVTAFAKTHTGLSASPII